MSAKGFIASFFDEIGMLFNPFTFPWGRMVMPMLTLIGAWGGFPEAPKMFQQLSQWRFFQYFFLWILVMQGGASADPGLSFIAVLMFVAISEGIKMYEEKNEEKPKK